jgi:hypothetical protein
MTRPYSLDLREPVAAGVVAGQSRRRARTYLTSSLRQNIVALFGYHRC